MSKNTLSIASLRERWLAWRDTTSSGTPDPATGSYIPALTHKLLEAVEIGDALLAALEGRPTAVSAEAIREKAARLCHQIEIANAIDDHGHKLTMNKAYLDLKILLEAS